MIATAGWTTLGGDSRQYPDSAAIARLQFKSTEKPHGTETVTKTKDRRAVRNRSKERSRQYPDSAALAGLPYKSTEKPHNTAQK